MRDVMSRPVRRSLRGRWLRPPRSPGVMPIRNPPTYGQRLFLHRRFQVATFRRAAARGCVREGYHAPIRARTRLPQTQPGNLCRWSASNTYVTAMTMSHAHSVGLTQRDAGELCAFRGPRRATKTASITPLMHWEHGNLAHAPAHSLLGKSSARLDPREDNGDRPRHPRCASPSFR
jgi:hypothetical protein